MLFLLSGGMRLISIPLMMVMLGAVITVHLKNGWLAIAEGSGFFATERTVDAIKRLDMAKSILQNYGNYQWLAAPCVRLVVLNNGVKFAGTCFYRGQAVMSVWIIGCKENTVKLWEGQYFSALFN